MMSKVNWAFRVSYLYLHVNFFCSGLISRQTQKLGIHSSSTTVTQAFQIPLLDQDSNGVLSAPQELQKPLMTLKEAIRSKEPSEKGTFFLLHCMPISEQDTDSISGIRSFAVCNQLASHSDIQKVGIFSSICEAIN